MTSSRGLGFDGGAGCSLTWVLQFPSLYTIGLTCAYIEVHNPICITIERNTLCVRLNNHFYKCKTRIFIRTDNDEKLWKVFLSLKYLWIRSASWDYVIYWNKVICYAMRKNFAFYIWVKQFHLHMKVVWPK